VKNTSLKRTQSLKSKPIKQKSKKRVKDQIVRVKLVLKMLEEHPRCGFPDCFDEAVDVHEILTRGRGGDFLDENNCVCLCRVCHRWVTDHPLEAEELGFVKSAYSA
jgi:hypothetical protein